MNRTIAGLGTCKGFRRSTWIVTLALMMSACTWNHTLTTLNNASGALAISPKIDIERSNRWVLPVNARLLVAGSAEPKILEQLVQGLSSRFAQVALAELQPGAAVADIELDTLKADALVFVHYAEKQPVRFWALGKRWRLPRPGLDFGRARIYMISLPFGHSVHSAQIVTRSALGRRVNSGQLERAFERFARDLRPVMSGG